MHQKACPPFALALGRNPYLLQSKLVLHEGKINALQRGKDSVKEVKKGFDCGITLENYSDFKEGDILECYEMVEVKR